MIALCISVFSSLVAAALCITSLMRSEETGVEVVRLAAAALALPPVVTLFFWGLWECISSVLGIAYVKSAPLHWVLWALMAASDLGMSLALAGNAGLLFMARFGPPAHKESLVSWRRKTAPLLGVLAVTELVSSVLYFAL